jgi:hypothetical protein
MKKRNRIVLLYLSALVVVSSLMAAPMLLQEVEQPRQVICAGNTSVTAGDVTLRASLGQPLVRTRDNGEITLRQGFWVGVESVLDWLIHLPLILR